MVVGGNESNFNNCLQFVSKIMVIKHINVPTQQLDILVYHLREIKLKYYIWCTLHARWPPTEQNMHGACTGLHGPE